jgi:hypothetical protein
MNGRTTRRAFGGGTGHPWSRLGVADHPSPTNFQFYLFIFNNLRIFLTFFLKKNNNVGFF